MKKLWRDLPAFSPPPQTAATDRLTVTSFRAWRLREPASGRRYTIVKLESRGGLTGPADRGRRDDGDPTLAELFVDYAAQRERRLEAKLAETEAALRDALVRVATLEAELRAAARDQQPLRG